MKRMGTLLLLALIAAACSTASQPSTVATSTSTPATAAVTTSTFTSATAAVTTSAPSTTQAPFDPPGLVGALPTGPCDGIGPTPDADEAQITFVIDERLYESNVDGTEIRCLTDGPFPTQWAGKADRLLARVDGVPAAINESGSTVLAVQGRFEGESWTRPTGTSVVGIAEDGRLVKYPIDGGPPVDLSFLDRHDEVLYHPAGTHVIVVGESAAGVYGIWLATNIGTESELLIEGTTATLSSASVSQDGLFMQFLADHGDVSHLHRIFLPDASTAEFDASIEHGTSAPLSHLVVSPFDNAELALAEGTCGADLHTVLPYWEGDVLPEFESRPIGFLPGFPARLLVAAYPDGCHADSPVDLYLVTVDQVEDPVLIVGGAHPFALPGLRVAHPDPPPPPGEFNLDDFA